MSQAPEPGSHTSDGLIKIKEVIDGSRETDDVKLVGRAQHALQVQKARLTRSRPTASVGIPQDP